MYCPNELTYIIQPGDNLYRIAQYYQTTVSDILSMNPGADPYNLQIGDAFTICPGAYFQMEADTSNPSACPDPAKQMELINNMRKAWSQHVYWSLIDLTSIADKLRDKDAVEARLMRNPGDIGKIFAEYYPPNAAQEITRLLTEHLKIGGAQATAERDRKTQQADTLNRKWYDNADQLASVLANLNPYYNEEEMRKMLYRHIDMAKQEFTRRLAGDYYGEVKVFDATETEALQMADMFSYGIMKQFPQRFL